VLAPSQTGDGAGVSESENNAVPVYVRINRGTPLHDPRPVPMELARIKGDRAYGARVPGLALLTPEPMTSDEAQPYALGSGINGNSIR